MTAPKSPIKAVIFDLGNVLVNFDAEKAVRRFAADCGVPVTKAWWHFFVSPHEKAYTRGEITCNDFYSAAKEVLKLKVDFETFRYYWNDIFWENEGMDELLAALKKKYALFLISNTNRMHFDYIQTNFKVLRHFDRLFASHEVGARKPEAAIYKKVLEDIKFAPGECVFIDDKLEFVRGARRSGMYSIQFRTKAQLLRDLKKLGVSAEG